MCGGKAITITINRTFLYNTGNVTADFETAWIVKYISNWPDETKNFTLFRRKCCSSNVCVSFIYPPKPFFGWVLFICWLCCSFKSCRSAKAMPLVTVQTGTEQPEHDDKWCGFLQRGKHHGIRANVFFFFGLVFFSPKWLLYPTCFVCISKKECQ